MTRTRRNVLLTGGLLIGLAGCGSANHTTVSSVVPDTSAVPVSVTDPTTTVSVPVDTVPDTTVPVTTVPAKTAPTTTVVAAAKPDLSAVLALVDSAENSGAAVDKELSTANNAMNSPEQDPQS